MILVRLVFQAKYGKAGELARNMAQEDMGPGAPKPRVLTDLSGQFDTVVMEMEVESLAAWEQGRQQAFSSPEFAESFQRSSELIVSGRAEFYTIES
jgi:hypothetical protein